LIENGIAGKGREGRADCAVKITEESESRISAAGDAEFLLVDVLL
jgi:hypothetical protein